MQIWDTAGQEKFRSLPQTFYRGNGILLVYSTTNRESFEGLYYWLDGIKKYSNNTAKILIGNITDPEREREVLYQEGKDFAEVNGMEFIETCPKKNENVDEAFEMLVKEILKSEKDGKENTKEEKKDEIKLTLKEKEKKRKCLFLK